MTKYNGIHHLAMITDDMDKTIEFWRDLLGMRMLAATGDGRNKHYFFEMSENNTIAFFEWPEAVNPDMKEHGTPIDEPMVFDHVAIGVNDDNDLEELRQILTKAGYWVSKITDHGFIHSIYSYDPNNIPIEFCAEVKGFSLREKPLINDKKLSKVAKS